MPHIGRIIAHWGLFEEQFNMGLSALIEGERESGKVRDTKGWIGSEYRRRKELAKEICRDWLRATNPAAADAYSQVCDRSADLRWQRDLIAHGAYSCDLLAKSHLATNFKATNSRNGDKLLFDATVLARLHHDISHLTADLISALEMFCKLEGTYHIVPDEQLLQVYRETTRQSRAKPEKPQSPPEPSQA